ncbi:MAG: extracellular solute-binding protein [Chloroflexi bacterium]|nr:extracellular solute-binding protein [Chloroflexota bacterium]MBV9544035.1 extracellular solute-binding protein [Chloroflexota bacterium]
MATSAVAILLAACGSGSSSYTPAGQQAAQPQAGGGQSTPAAGAAQSGQKVHLVYFNARGAEAVERALVNKYMQDHPNIEIEYLSATSLSGPSDTDAIANLIFNIQAKKVVDVAKIEVSRTPLDLMAANAEQELTAIGGDAVKTQLKGLLNSNYVDINNGVWAIPYEYDPFGYVYNADMYKDAGLNPDAPPKSWDELRQVNTTIKSKNANAWPICQPINNLAKTMPWVWTSGADFWDRPILPTKADFTNKVVTDVYKFQQEWSQKQWRNTDEVSTSNDQQLMISRKCAAMIYSSYFILLLQVNDPKTDWRVAPIQSEDGSGQPKTYGGGSALAIPSTAAQPKEAMDFILWLTSDDAQRLKYGVTQGLGLADQDLYSQANPASIAVSDQLKNDPKWKQSILTVPSQPPGVSPAFSKIYQLLADMQERVVRSNADVPSELSNVQQQSQQLLDQAIANYPQLYPKS